MRLCTALLLTTIVLVPFAVLHARARQQPASRGKTDKTPEATSLLGTPLYAVELAPQARAAAEENLAQAA